MNSVVRTNKVGGIVWLGHARHWEYSSKDMPEREIVWLGHSRQRE